MERKLAHIELITALEPIEGADKIEKATVLGWQCVVNKREFQVNDKIIYIEIDSILPDIPEYEFLRSRNFRVRTIKLKGQISQGLVIPIPKDWLNIACEVGTDVTEELGITKYLTPSEKIEIEENNKSISNEKNKLKKFMMRYSWFRKLFLSKKQTTKLPYWVSKTDEERIQNIPEVLNQYKDEIVYVTEKVDYQSVTFTSVLISKFNWLKLPIISSYKKEQLNKMKKLGKQPFKIILNDEIRYTISSNIEQVQSRNTNHVVKSISWLKFMCMWYITNLLNKFNTFKLIVCSRNLVNNDKNSLYWEIAKKYNIEQILRENPTLTIQGEQGNTKVQDNKYGIKEPTIWIFNIIDHEKQYFYNYEEMREFCHRYNLQTVPLRNAMIGEGDNRRKLKLSDLGSTVQELVEFSKGKSIINPKINREGIVVRCIKDGKKVLSFKVVNPDFLLKYSDE